LQAGATFSGSFTLPAKGCDDQHWITSGPARLPACRLRAPASPRATPELARFQGDRRFTVHARSGFCLRLFIPTPILPPLDLSAWLLAQITTALSVWRSPGQQNPPV